MINEINIQVTPELEILAGIKYSNIMFYRSDDSLHPKSVMNIIEGANTELVAPTEDPDMYSVLFFITGKAIHSTLKKYYIRVSRLSKKEKEVFYSFVEKLHDEYIFIKAHTQYELQKKISFLLSCGWEMHGVPISQEIGSKGTKENFGGLYTSSYTEKEYFYYIPMILKR